MDTPKTGSTAGFEAYEHLVDNINAEGLVVDEAVSNIIDNDPTGQFSASAVRYLAAVDRQLFADNIDRLLKAVIDKDRQKAYLPDLLPAVWGTDYISRAQELREADDNFRRIYKRVHPSGVI